MDYSFLAPTVGVYNLRIFDIAMYLVSRVIWKNIHPLVSILPTYPLNFIISELSVMSKKDIYYSDKYTDDNFEYRHVMLPKDLAKLVPKTHLMSEAEWRNLGVQQSLGEVADLLYMTIVTLWLLGWVHYMLHEPEPHILLFRRSLSK